MGPRAGRVFRRTGASGCSRRPARPLLRCAEPFPSSPSSGRKSVHPIPRYRVKDFKTSRMRGGFDTCTTPPARSILTLMQPREPTEDSSSTGAPLPIHGRACSVWRHLARCRIDYPFARCGRRAPPLVLSGERRRRAPLGRRHHALRDRVAPRADPRAALQRSGSRATRATRRRPGCGS